MAESQLYSQKAKNTKLIPSLNRYEYFLLWDKARRISMGKIKINKNSFIILLLLAVSLILGLQYFNINSLSPKQIVVKSENTNLIIKGENGKDALSLLKENADIKVAKSGLITSINGREARESNHEFWAFYINSKMSQVGPAQYKTKDTDTIEWKIKQY